MANQHLGRIATLTFLLVPAAVFAAEKPNIILVMADDQGWGDMAYNGHEVVKTPNSDKAAATGDSSESRDVAADQPEVVAD